MKTVGEIHLDPNGTYKGVFLFLSSFFFFFEEDVLFEMHQGDANYTKTWLTPENKSTYLSVIGIRITHVRSAICGDVGKKMWTTSCGIVRQLKCLWWVISN